MTSETMDLGGVEVVCHGANPDHAIYTIKRPFATNFLNEIRVYVSADGDLWLKAESGFSFRNLEQFRQLEGVICTLHDHGLRCIAKVNAEAKDGA